MARKSLLVGFKKPKSINFEHVEHNPNYGKFVAHPFETGFGTTVGNTLRRILLSSIPGYAISSVRITSIDADGVEHVISEKSDPVICLLEGVYGRYVLIPITVSPFDSAIYSRTFMCIFVNVTYLL